MEKTAQQFHIRRLIWSVFGWGAVILAALCMIGVVVCLIMIGLDNERLGLMGALCGGFTGGAAVFGLSGFLCVRASERNARAEADAIERADSEDSFFVGEGTLATFCGDRLKLHAQSGRKTIFVPYAEMRFFSVCTRTAPKERGEWCVAFEIPVKYLREGKNKKDEPPVLIQAEGKERLYSRLEAHGLVLLGECPPRAGETKKSGKFTFLRKFSIPDRAKRRRAMIFFGVGLLAFAGGFVGAFFQPMIGGAVAVVGAYVAGHALISFFRAATKLLFYREGVWLREAGGRRSAGTGNYFLKWEEISSLTCGQDAIRAECLYGAVDLPRPEGAFEWIEETFPEKTKRQ